MTMEVDALLEENERGKSFLIEPLCKDLLWVKSVKTCTMEHF